MQTGRKIYYEKSTGNVTIDTGEREGSVVETTTAQDFASYVALFQRVPDTVGMIQLVYGQDREKFGVYAYHVESGAIVWDLTPMQVEKIAEQATLESRIAEIEATQVKIVDALGLETV